VGAKLPPLPPIKWNWHLFEPWQVSDYHDTAQTPEVRKMHTPYGTVLGIISPLTGGKHAEGYPPGTIGTHFEIQHGKYVYRGWLIAKGGKQDGRNIARTPDRTFARDVLRQLRLKYARRMGWP